MNKKAKIENFITMPASPSTASFLSNQPRLETHLTDSRKNFITNKLCNLVINRSLPIDIIASDEMKEYSSALNNLYTVPTTSAFVETLVPALVERTRRVLHDKVDKLNHVSITSDIWTDETMRSYIAFCAHGIIVPEWTRFEGLLAVEPIPRRRG